MSITHYAIVFPGQGSQSIGMVNTFSEKYPIVKQTFAEASDVLGYDLFQLVMAGPEEKLNQTIYTQPAMLTAGVAVWRVVNEFTEPHPTISAGHSLGEYTALVCAEALSFTDAVKTVAKRAQLMQEATANGVGAMGAVIGLADEDVVQLCQEIHEGTVTPANYNSPGQIVVAGHTAAVEKLLVAAKNKGAKIAKLLPVSVPSHCMLMQPACAPFAEFLQSIAFQTPKFAILHNYDVHTHLSAEEIKHALVAQLCLPVRWVETIEKMVQHGIQIIYEFGPNKVLTGLNKRIASEITTLNISEEKDLIAFTDPQ